MLSQDQVQEIINKSLPSIVEGFKEDLRNKITWEVRDAAAKLVKDEVEKWVKENIIPEIITVLTESKAGLVAVATPLAEGMTVALSESLLGVMKQRLESSWDRKKIFEALFT